jgi:hypothetical protein
LRRELLKDGSKAHETTKSDTLLTFFESKSVRITNTLQLEFIFDTGW